MLEAMAKRVVQCAACVFFLLVAFTPMLECFDHWDGPTTPLTDTELRVTAWLVVAGTVAVVAHAVRFATMAAENRDGFLLLFPVLRVALQTAAYPAEPTTSPPAAPLRI